LLFDAKAEQRTAEYTINCELWACVVW
jgi:hypothetical protein